MRKLSHFSHFGGEEIVQIEYPSIYKILIEQKNNSCNTKKDSDNFFISEKIKQTHDLHKIISIDTTGNIFPISQMENIPVYLLSSLLFYFPDNKRHGFWFDLFTLNYLYSKKYFNVCLLYFSIGFLQNNGIQYSQFVELLNDKNHSFLSFPYECYIEEIK